MRVKGRFCIQDYAFKSKDYANGYLKQEGVILAFKYTCMCVGSKCIYILNTLHMLCPQHNQNFTTFTQILALLIFVKIIGLIAF